MAAVPFVSANGNPFSSAYSQRPVTFTGQMNNSVYNTSLEEPAATFMPNGIGSGSWFDFSAGPSAPPSAPPSAEPYAEQQESWAGVHGSTIAKGVAGAAVLGAGGAAGMSALQSSRDALQRIYGQGVQLRDELAEVLEFGVLVIGFIIVLFLLLEIKQAFFNQPKQPHGGVGTTVTRAVLRLPERPAKNFALSR